jgi:broad specificity phosphatase PhoE
MPALLLVRHAQASYGGADYDVLSERGHEQVAAVKAALDARGVRPAALVSGSLRRQRDTAAAFATDAAAVAIDPRWNEYDAADLLSHHSDSGLRLERPEDDPAPRPSSKDFQGVLDRAMLDWIAAGADGPAAETWPAFRDRTRGALADALRGLGRGETGLAFTSGGVIAAVCALVLGVPDEAFVALNRTSVNASVTKVISGGRGASLVSFNEHAHLEAPGLVTYR